jgi:RNA polymerase sigma factor (sigma-70 family)
VGSVRAQDEVLFAACRAGDADAFGEIVRRHAPLVLGVVRAYRLMDDDAADVAQITWGRFIDRMQGIRSAAAVPAWLARTARNESVNVLRLRRREFLDDGALTAHVGTHDVRPNDLAADEAERVRRCAVLDRAIRSLPDRERRLVLFLRAYPDAAYREIAASIPMPIGSIGPIRKRAFGRLRAELAAAGVTAALGDSAPPEYPVPA